MPSNSSAFTLELIGREEDDFAEIAKYWRQLARKRGVRSVWQRDLALEIMPAFLHRNAGALEADFWRWLNAL